MKYTDSNIYDLICEYSKKGDVVIEKVDQKYTGGGVPNRDICLKMKSHWHPWSIKKTEFLFLKNFIKINKMQRAYEVATAFGISSLAIGLGLKATKGKVVTMDAYIEERYNDSNMYMDKKEIHYENNDGYKSVQHIIDVWNLKNTVFPMIGWSPDDTERNLAKVFNLQEEKLDFVFIDGGHFPSQIIKDVESVIPFLGKDFAIFFHDSDFADSVHQFLREKFGKTVECVIPRPVGWDLGMLLSDTRKWKVPRIYEGRSWKDWARKLKTVLKSFLTT